MIWGIPYLLIRVAVEELSPAALVFWRTAPAALLLAPFAFRRGALGLLLARWRWVTAYTLIEIAVPWLLLFHAEQRISSSLAGLLVAAVPLLGAVVYRLAGVAERLDARRLAGLVIGFGGVAALVGIDVGDSDPLAMAEVIVVALCYATGPLIISRRLRGLPNLAVVAASLVITAAIYTPPGLLDSPGSVSAETVAAVVTLALVCTVLGVRGLLRAHPRGRARPRHGDHLCQPAGGGPARRRADGRAVHRGHRRGAAADPARLGARDGAGAQRGGDRPTSTAVAARTPAAMTSSTLALMRKGRYVTPPVARAGTSRK